MPDNAPPPRPAPMQIGWETHREIPRRHFGPTSTNRMAHCRGVEDRFVNTAVPTNKQQVHRFTSEETFDIIAWTYGREQKNIYCHVFFCDLIYLWICFKKKPTELPIEARGHNTDEKIVQITGGETNLDVMDDSTLSGHTFVSLASLIPAKKNTSHPRTCSQFLRTKREFDLLAKRGLIS